MRESPQSSAPGTEKCGFFGHRRRVSNYDSTIANIRRMRTHTIGVEYQKKPNVVDRVLTKSKASFKKFLEKLRSPGKKEEKKDATKPTATEPAKATETKPADAEPATAPATEPTATATEGETKPAEADATGDAAKATEGKKAKLNTATLFGKAKAHFHL